MKLKTLHSQFFGHKKYFYRWKIIIEVVSFQHNLQIVDLVLWNFPLPLQFAFASFDHVSVICWVEPFAKWFTETIWASLDTWNKLKTVTCRKCNINNRMDVVSLSIINYTSKRSSSKWPTKNLEATLGHVNHDVVYPKILYKIALPN